MSSVPTGHPESLSGSESSKKDSAEDRQVFASLFSHSGALWLAEIAKRAIEGAKARLRALGIEPEDPSSDDEGPNFKLS
jgi:hypothetical protein